MDGDHDHRRPLNSRMSNIRVLRLSEFGMLRSCQISRTALGGSCGESRTPNAAGDLSKLS